MIDRADLADNSIPTSRFTDCVAIALAAMPYAAGASVAVVSRLDVHRYPIIVLGGWLIIAIASVIALLFNWEIVGPELKSREYQKIGLAHV